MDSVISVTWKRKTAAFLTGQCLSLFGSQLVQMAIIWHVTLTTSSGLWVTCLTLAAFLPQMVLSLFGGVWADRYNRKWLIILADSIIAIATLFLALFLMAGYTGDTALVAIVVVSVIRSLGSGVQTPAVNAVLPQIVPEDNLARVNGYNGAIQSIVQFVSPIAAGAIMAVGPIYSIMFIDVFTAVLAVCILAFIQIPRLQPAVNITGGSVFSELKEGLRFTWNHLFLRRLLASYGAFIFLSVPSGFLTALMIQRTFGDNVILLTINETVGFAGAVLGGLLLGATGGFTNRALTLSLGFILYGLASFAVGFTSVFWLFVVLMFFIGLTIPAAQTSVFTLVQEKVEPSMMGRVFSLVNVMFTGFMPLGMAIFGPLADVVRIQVMVIGCAAFIILLGLSLISSRDFFKEGQSVTIPETISENAII